MSTIRRVDLPDSVVAWLRGQPNEEVSGYDATVGTDSIWLLHAMYENPGLPSGLTYDDIHKVERAAGLTQPLIIGDLNLDDVSTVVGPQFGFAPDPGPDWRRLRWSEHAKRLGFVLGSGQNCPPAYTWFTHGSWPINTSPPPEGSLDEVSVNALAQVLAAHSSSGPDTPCWAFYCTLATGDFDSETVFEGRLADIATLVKRLQGVDLTPTNFWPDDRAWFVWSDWDLLATKVSGSETLISDLRHHPDLETLSWPQDSRTILRGRL